MSIETQNSIIIILVAFVTSIMMLNLWYNSSYLGFGAEQNPAKPLRDPGLFYVSAALMIWSISGLSLLLFTKNGYFIKCFFSSINNLLLLIGISYFEYAPDILKKNKKDFHSGAVVGFIITCFLSFIFKTAKNDKFNLSVPDFLLSLFTAGLLSYVLVVSFWKRNLLILSFFSFIALGLLMMNQSAFLIYFNLNANEWMGILGLYARISFIILICLLAYSSEQIKHNDATNKLTTLEDQVSSLEERISTVKSSAQKDERDSAWQDVAMKAAHKIGNPLEAIDTYRGRMYKRLNVQDIKGARIILDDMNHSIEEAKHVVNEFKSLTTLNTKKLEYLNLVKLIKDTTKRINDEDNIVVSIKILNRRFTIDQGKANSVVLGFDESIDIHVDREKIKQCLNELISNSLHFFDANKKDKKINITVEYIDNKNIPETLSQENHYIRVIYEDNGIGIPKESKSQIFNPFFTTYQHGTGLGLSIVGRIIELHDGVIFENGKEGIGVRFEIVLPINTV